MVCGHSHRQGYQPVSYGHGGKISHTIWGLEAGCLMDQAQAEYLTAKGGYANWQMGFATLTTFGDLVHPVLVPIYEGGKFIVEGVLYG